MKKNNKLGIVCILFLLSNLLIALPATAGSLDVTVYTNKISYLPNENVTIFGNLTFNSQPVEQNGLVGLQLNDTVGPVFLRTVSVGPYNLTPIVEVLSIIPCDYHGNPKTSFSRGEDAFFFLTARNNDIIRQQTALLAASIFDRLGRPLDFVGAVKLTMDPASIAQVLFGPIQIKTWSASGDARVYGNAFADWPHYQGVPYCPEKSAAFTIVGLEYEGLSPATFGGDVQTIEGSSYQLMFRLSPESRAGEYRIYASANYGGWKAFSTRTFMVPSSPYSPEAFFEYVPRPESWVGCNMTFDASSSVANGYGDYIKKFAWNFGDGTPIQEKTTSKIHKTFTSSGTYNVTLNVTDNEGLWNMTWQQITVLVEKRDIAVTKLEVLSEIYVNWTVNATVTVRNLGGPSSATFNLSLWHNSTKIATQTITNLAPWPSGTATVTFTWNTSGLTPYLVHVLQVQAEPIPDESNTTNNVYTVTFDKVKMLGDITGDKNINIYDAVRVLVAYGSKPGNSNWDVQADLMRDNLINIYDVVIVTSQYGKKYTG